MFAIITKEKSSQQQQQNQLKIGFEQDKPHTHTRTYLKQEDIEQIYRFFFQKIQYKRNLFGNRNV